ncbi:MAG TPA: GvpL/GvpF family gas vesicle protein [Terriglobales bacterium]|nr:GvpL/GvpF family gas vesicle protein [Terriglobales bacterium]
MAWYAYCIVEQQALLGGARARRPFPITNIQGIGNSPVLGYPSGDFAVVVSPYGPATLDQQAARDHARVVGECFKFATVLPFRFGTVFDNDEALRRAVRSNRRHFQENVAQLRGKSEMHLKLVVRDGSLREVGPEVLPAKVGLEYLNRLRERAALDRDRQSKAKTLSVQVHRLFNPLAEEISCKKVDSGGLLIDIAHLIDSKSVEKYQNRYAAATRQFKNCELVISGPWPPYHFLRGKGKAAN